MSRATISGPVRLSRVLIGYCDRVRRISSIGRARSIGTTAPPSAALVDIGQEARRVGFQLFEKDALGSDLAEDLAVGRARHADPDRQAGAVARQADDPHVVTEIFAAELRADAEATGQFEHLGLELAIAIGLAPAIAFSRQTVEITAAGQLDRLQVHFRRGAADHDGEVIGRAGRGAERADLLVEKFEQRFRDSAPPLSADRESSCWPSRRLWR